MSTPTKVVLLSCGSFNPITNMHLRMFEVARDTLHKTGKFRVIGGIISPVNDAYGKKGLVTSRHRVNMARSAVQSSDWIRVDPWESELDEWSPTLKVLRHHKDVLDSMYNANPLPDTPTKKRKIDSDEVDYSIPTHNMPMNLNLNEMGPVQLKLLCGADLLESFAVPNLWADEDVEEIVGRFGMVCISRSGTNSEKFIYESDVLSKYQNNIHLVTEWISNEISATKIRRALRRQESVKYLLQDSVIDYIKANHLYGCTDNKYVHVDPVTPSPDDMDSSSTHDSGFFMTNAAFQNLYEPSSVRVSPNGSSFRQSPNGTSVRQSPNGSPRRPVTCMADIGGLVRRIKTMKVAWTPETCV